MLKKRIIFTLLVDKDVFVLSRNFSLQTVGDLRWINENYDFGLISNSIDELVVLNVERDKSNIINLSEKVKELSQTCFIPLAAGGGIRSDSDVQLLLNSGADKVILNTQIFKEPELVKSLVRKYGSQCIVASIDYKLSGDRDEVFISNGRLGTGVSVNEAIRFVQELGVGEIYLTSIEQDGTGTGYDIGFINKLSKDITIPLIISGGAGKSRHIIEGLKLKEVNAVSTANLFNFMLGGIKKSREAVIKENIPLASWISPEEYLDRISQLR